MSGECLAVYIIVYSADMSSNSQAGLSMGSEVKNALTPQLTLY